MPLPIHWTSQNRDTTLQRPLTGQPVGTTGITVDRQGDMVLGMQPVQDGPDQATVSRRHYLQVTDDHFTRATQPGDVDRSIFVATRSKNVASKTRQGGAKDSGGCKIPQDSALPRNRVGDAGLEPVTSAV
jgi:hypothetical protein